MCLLFTRSMNRPKIVELARAIKSRSEIKLMRWTMRVCEAGMARSYEHSLPGTTELELWDHLHHENARYGGAWGWYGG